MTTLPEPYYQDASCTIYNADCKNILPLLEPVDLVLTDPPYGIGADIGQNKRAGKRHGAALCASTTYIETNWDSRPPSAWLFELMREMSTHQAFFGGNYFALPPTRCLLIWDKDNGDNDYADCEVVWTNKNAAIRRFKWKWHGMLQEDMKNKEHRQHPTQKPLPVMKWCIGQFPNTKTILDPFMGSGTTLVAAKHLGLHAIGIEREEKYCAIAVERLRQESLFSVMGGA